MCYTPRVSKSQYSISHVIIQVRLSNTLIKPELTTGAGGSALTLDELLSTTLFYRNGLPSHRGSDMVLALNGSTFPLLSQGDHPVLGTPCWYFHPCETAQAVDELQQASSLNDLDDKEHWLELWFLLVGNVVNLRTEPSR